MPRPTAGRPTIGPGIRIAIPQYHLDVLAREAKRTRRHVYDIIRDLIADHVTRWAQDDYEKQGHERAALEQLMSARDWLFHHHADMIATCGDAPVQSGLNLTAEIQHYPSPSQDRYTVWFDEDHDDDVPVADTFFITLVQHVDLQGVPMVLTARLPLTLGKDALIETIWDMDEVEAAIRKTPVPR